jgi:heparosan-N-sulfate-glucuronate 5-epimerase
MSAVTRLVGAAQATLSFGPGYEPQPLNQRACYDSPCGYFVDFSAKTDNGGRRIVNARGERLEASPVATAQRALGWFERAVIGQPGSAAAFVGTASDLRSSASVVGRGRRSALLWFYTTDVAKYRIRAPWLSAMAQAQAASVFVRLHILTGDPEHARWAREAIRPLLDPSIAGGLCVAVGDGVALEEYPSFPHSHVLNGWIYALWGLWDTAHAFDDVAAATVFERSSATLASFLPSYDTGWWSRYSLFPLQTGDLAKPFYHRLHAVQLRVLTEMTGVQSFVEFARRWEAQDTRSGRLRAIWSKAQELRA